MTRRENIAIGITVLLFCSEKIRVGSLTKVRVWLRNLPDPF